MSLLHKTKTDDELTNIGLKNPSNVPYSRITLASVESLTLPLIQEVVLLADFRCKGCQERVADIMSRMNGVTESVVISVMDNKVTLTSTYPGIVKLNSMLGSISFTYNSLENVNISGYIFVPYKEEKELEGNSDM
ncbi:Heavy metal-associated domain containing protein [Heracleum sosnowskyi]|uniref:Heavy metal-associated domain containing protein n=1 Tax=Heracleum sosnowskyi TaxID=360622 RepID=A0AAD8IT52_9APIA|nr:Heavy metal-associated domain containing protein [Heracleum sosnowskyi]